MSDATPGNQEATLSPAVEREAQSPDTFYVFRLPNGAVHQGSDLAYIKREHPQAVITNRVTLDALGQAEFHPYSGQQPFEGQFAAPEEAPAVDEPQRAEEVRDSEQPAKARAKK